MNFLHDWEFDSIFIESLLNFLGIARFLGAILIAWICQNLEAFFSIIGVHLDQLGVVPLGFTSFRGHIHNDDGLFICQNITKLLNLGTI